MVCSRSDSSKASAVLLPPFFLQGGPHLASTYRLRCPTKDRWLQDHPGAWVAGDAPSQLGAIRVSRRRETSVAANLLLGVTLWCVGGRTLLSLHCYSTASDTPSPHLHHVFYSGPATATPRILA